jgi:large subunit ribosomal protein L35
VPKIKTNRAAAKRFKPTGTGKFKHRQAYKNHILTKKSAKRKRHLKHLVVLPAADQNAVERMMPYC